MIQTLSISITSDNQPFPVFAIYNDIFVLIHFRIGYFHKNKLSNKVCFLQVRHDKGWMTAYNVRTNFSSPLRVDELMTDHSRLYHSLTSLVRSAKDSLGEVFDAFTVAEWIEQKIYPMILQLEEMQKDANVLKSHRIWPKRPFQPLRDLERLGVPMPDNVIPPPG